MNMTVTVPTDDQPTFVKNNGVEFVVITKNMYSAFSETGYLLSNKANREHLSDSMRQLEAGETVEYDIDQL